MRKKASGAAVITIILLAFLAVIIVNRPDEGVVTMEQGSLIHYKPEDHFIGDVHPFFHNGECYMFYLKPGNYASTLVVSDDLLHWEPKKLEKPVSVVPTKEYFVLGVIKDGSLFRSFYGNGTFVGASHSDDLLKWHTSSLSYTSDVNMELFPVGARDPFVFFDNDNKVYRCVSTAYRENKKWDRGDTMDCSIAIVSTEGNTPTGWGKQTELKRFIDGFSGEPECSQMFQINGRWYLLASLAYRSVHHVGKPSYWIGDKNTGILEDDWNNKQEYSLNGEDLCAAQVAFDGKRWLMWGWIPQNWSGNQWGGHLSLPLEVYALKDGELATRLEKGVSRNIRGELLWKSGKVNSDEGDSFHVPGHYDRFDVEFEVAGGEADVCLSIGKEENEVHIELSRSQNGLRIVAPGVTDGGYIFSSIDVNGEWVREAQTIRVLAEEDIVEVFLGDRYSLCARINRKLSRESLSITGRSVLKEIKVYRLKWFEEV